MKLCNYAYRGSLNWRNQEIRGKSRKTSFKTMLFIDLTWNHRWWVFLSWNFFDNVILKVCYWMQGNNLIQLQSCTFERNNATTGGAINAQVLMHCSLGFQACQYFSVNWITSRLLSFHLSALCIQTQIAWKSGVAPSSGDSWANTSDMWTHYVFSKLSAFQLMITQFSDSLSGKQLNTLFPSICCIYLIRNLANSI